MLSEDELVETPNNILLIFGILIIQMLYQLRLNETLLVQSLFVLEDLERCILSELVIVALEYNAEAAFAKLLDDFVPVGQVLVDLA